MNRTEKFVRQFLRSSCDSKFSLEPDLKFVCSNGETFAHKFAILSVLPDLKKLFCEPCLLGHDTTAIILPETRIESVTEARDFLYMYGDVENMATIFGMKKVREKIPLTFRSRTQDQMEFTKKVSKKMKDINTISMSEVDNFRMNVRPSQLQQQVYPPSQPESIRDYLEKAMNDFQERQKSLAGHNVPVDKKQNVDIVTLESETNSTPENHAMQSRNIVSLSRENPIKEPVGSTIYKRRIRGPYKKSSSKLNSPTVVSSNVGIVTSKDISLTTSPGSSSSPGPSLIPKSNVKSEVSITLAVSPNSVMNDDATKNNSSEDITNVIDRTEDERSDSEVQIRQKEKQDLSKKLIMSNNDELEIEEFMELVEDDGREMETVSEVTLNTRTTNDIGSITKESSMIPNEMNEFPLTIKKIDFSDDSTKKSVEKLNSKPFKCEECDFSTKYKTVLKEHQRRGHKGKERLQNTKSLK